MDYVIETFEGNKQLLGTDFSRVVRGAKSKKKVENALKDLKDTHKRLESIKSWKAVQLNYKISAFDN